jgi:AcrR family transcriptional regulator
MNNLTRRDREKSLREEEIISAAEKIFCLKSFDEASMDEIAKEAQFTKRTLYQYFESKEDLYRAVVLKGFSRMFSFLSEMSDNEQTGYIRIQQSCSYLYQFYKDNPQLFRVISSWGYIKNKFTIEDKNSNVLTQFKDNILQPIVRMIEDGKADGSINAYIDSEKTALSLFFLMTGFLNQLSITSGTFADYFSLNIDSLSIYTVDLLLGTLRQGRGPLNMKWEQ